MKKAILPIEKSLGENRTETEEKGDSIGKGESFIMITLILLSILISFLIEETDFANLLVRIRSGF